MFAKAKIYVFYHIIYNQTKGFLMFKFLLYLLLSLNLYASDILISNENGTASFIKNQKYVCVFTRAFMDDKEIYVMSREEAFKYPTRFYVNNKNILITDKGQQGKFYQDGIYINQNKQTMGWILNVKSEKEKYLAVRDIVENQEMMMLYTCTETNNWTLSK